MMQKFKAGDLVKLKSGGPTMTVNRYHPQKPNVIVTWFDKEDKPQSGRYSEEALDEVENTQV